jgi:Bacteriophage Sf6, terminase small subunit-like
MRHMRQGKKTDLRALQTAFLARLAQGESVATAASAIHTARGTVYRWRAADPEFKEAWEFAYEEGTDVLEDEAQRRAVDGVHDFRLDRHGVEHPFTRYSDALLMCLLKARRPERFRDNVKVERGHKPDVPPIAHRNAPRLTLKDIRDLADRLTSDESNGGGPSNRVAQA